MWFLCKDCGLIIRSRKYQFARNNMITCPQCDGIMCCCNDCQKMAIEIIETIEDSIQERERKEAI